MHEHFFIQAILKDIPEKEKVLKIVLEVGELVGIESNHLKEHLKKEINSEVEVILEKANVKCDCGYIGSPLIKARMHDLVIFECPKCGGLPEILEGKDIKILKIVYK